MESNREKNDIENFTIGIDEKTRNTLYNIIKQTITRTYTESMFIVLISRLRAEKKIEKPQEIIDYMINKPLDFYKQILEQFKEPDSANTFIKTLFDEISRTIGIHPVGKEIIEALQEGNEAKFREKILEIIYTIRTKTPKTIY